MIGSGGRRRLASLVAAALLAAACGANDELDGDQGSIEVFAPYRGVEADVFAEVLADFERSTGIDVQYLGSADFVSDLVGRLVGDERPDVAIVPQPGFVAALDDRDVLVEHGERTLAAIDEAGLDTDTLTLGRGDVAVPYRTTIKSLVWFRPDVFEANGWSTPTTLDELIELVDEIQAVSGETGLAPWCFSIASGTATGWPATDWVEDLLLRLHGDDVYDAWVAGEIDFRDERVDEVFVLVARLVLADGRVAGDRRSLLQTDVVDTSDPLFGTTPGCAMYKQASFAYDWFPEEPTIGPDGDIDVFVLPGVDDGPPPLVVGGDSAVAFDDRPEVDEFMAFLASPEGAAAWARAGGYLSARTDVDVGRYFAAASQPLIELLQTGGLVRFDGSDAMEPQFGSGVFWQEMTSWMSGSQTREVTQLRLDAARAVDLPVD